MIAIMSRSLELLFAGVATRDFAAGEPVFHAGDKVVSMFLVRRGCADLIRHTGHGLRMVLHRAGPGSVLAEASAWSDVYHCDAVAAGPCQMGVLSRAAFRKRLSREPAVAEIWARSLARAVQSARLQAEIRSLPKVADRLDAWLGEGNQLPEKGRWQEVAAELGVTREALYREMSRRRTMSLGVERS
jgi:CRP/FNR family transcriptional regulator, dissimilatory nitrate respiration regulator